MRVDGGVPKTRFLQNGGRTTTTGAEAQCADRLVVLSTAVSASKKLIRDIWDSWVFQIPVVGEIDRAAVS